MLNIVYNRMNSIVQAAQAAPIQRSPRGNGVDAPGKGPVVAAGSRTTIELMGGVTWERLTTGPQEEAELLEICYAPGATSGSAMSHHSGREFGVILEGTLVIDLGF